MDITERLYEHFLCTEFQGAGTPSLDFSEVSYLIHPCSWLVFFFLISFGRISLYETDHAYDPCCPYYLSISDIICLMPVEKQRSDDNVENTISTKGH